MVMFFIILIRIEQETLWMGASDDVIYLVPCKGTENQS